MKLGDVTRRWLSLTGLFFTAGALGAASCADAPGGPVSEALGETAQALSCTTLVRGSSVVEDAPIAFDPTDPSKANQNYGNTAILNTGLVGPSPRQSLVRFDLSPIPANVAIASATLTLRKVSTPGNGTVNLHAVTAPWSEASVTYTSFGGAFDSAIQATIDVATAPNGVPLSTDLTALVAAWMSGATPNHGVLLEQNAAGRGTFGSSEAAGGPVNLPQLTVCYGPATCGDGIQNGQENGVDCGGPCAPCGACQGVVCTPLDACHVAGSCNAATGLCSNPIAPWGTACDDGDACTQTDYCQSGQCVGGNSVVCTAPDTCHAAGTCDFATGVCGAGAPVACCSDGQQNQGETGVDCGGPCSACADPGFSGVELLLHMDGAQGSTSFVDVKGHAVSVTGNTSISTAQSVFGGASGFFDGSGDTLATPTSSVFNLAGSTPFTVESWINGTGTLLSSDDYGMVLSIKNGTTLYFWLNGILPWTSTGTAVGTVPSGWHHVAVSYSGVTYRVFIDGVQTFSVNGAMTSQTYSYLRIGAYASGTQPYFSGYMDDFRYTHGAGRYTANFTPPSSPFPDN